MYKRFPQIVCLSSSGNKPKTTASYKEDTKKELRGRSRKPLKKSGILEKGEIRCGNYDIPCTGVRGKSLAMDIIIMSNVLLIW